MRTITNSEITTWHRCPREWRIAYRDLVRPVEPADALRVGTAVHACLERWMHARTLASILPTDQDFADAFERAAWRAVLLAYAKRWISAELEVLAVEVPFRVTLRNPATGRASRTFELAGKLDAVVRTTSGVYVLEHKTTSEDFSIGSSYRKRLRLDGQVSTYLDAARELGFGEVRGMLYDVIRKPALRPLRATPPEDRAYVIADRAAARMLLDGRPWDDVSREERARLAAEYPGAFRLSKTQREQDETPADFGVRVLEAIADRPDDHFARFEVVRLEEEEQDGRFDRWQTARAIADALEADRFPRNVSSCVRYGRTCPYFGPCSGEERLDDPRLYRFATTPHEELPR